MSSDPLRLRDDPAFRAGTGCDLDDESLALDTPDLVSLRARVLAAANPGSPPQPRRRWLGAAAALGVVVLALLAGWLADEPASVSAVAAPPSPVVAPVSPGLTPSPELPSPRPPAPLPVAGVSPASRPRGGTVTAVSEPVAAVPGTSATPPLPASPPERVPEPARRSGDLAEQVAALEAAEAQLASGEPLAAVAAFETMAARWPSGVFLAESRLGALRAHAAAGDWARVEVIAAELAADPELSTRRADVLTLRAEALAALGRCAEAKDVARPLGSATRARVGAACR